MKNITLFLLVLAFLGCKDNSSKQIVDSVTNTLSNATAQWAPMANNMASQTTEQASKVFRYEYKVLTLEKSSLNDTAIESMLNKLGEERWECFSILPVEAGTRITCRRVPYAALRYFLRLM